MPEPASEPLLKKTPVRCPVAHAFAVFTDKVDLWWPRSHRRFEVSTLTLEARVGGRFFERAHGGEEATLGEVLAYEPPHRLLYTWKPGSSTGPTQVEVRFTPHGGGTLVEIIHSVGQAHDVFAERVSLFDRAWSLVLPAFVSEAERPKGEG